MQREELVRVCVRVCVVWGEGGSANHLVLGRKRRPARPEPTGLYAVALELLLEVVNPLVVRCESSGRVRQLRPGDQPALGPT